jgi:hypothetical protein
MVSKFGMMRRFFLTLLGFSLPVVLAASAAGAFDPGKTGFSVRVNSEVSPYRVMAFYVLPEQSTEIEVIGTQGRASLEASAGELRRSRMVGRWTWTAPARSGVYQLTARDRGTGERSTLNAFVMVPRERLGEPTDRINGYKIGHYPAEPLNGLSIYEPPAGFIEVTEANEHTLLSPHFRLQQFICKQDGGYPKYVVLRERLLLMLETLLEHVNGLGMRAESFHVMSGYRTPFYNHSIGNVPYSRHVFGGAADVFIDESPRDGVMDDLDGNGRIDRNDARYLYRIVDELFGEKNDAHGHAHQGGDPRFVGGLGLYDWTEHHGPFVHVDVRGYRARWGY